MGKKKISTPTFHQAQKLIEMDYITKLKSCNHKVWGKKKIRDYLHDFGGQVILLRKKLKHSTNTYNSMDESHYIS